MVVRKGELITLKKSQKPKVTSGKIEVPTGKKVVHTTRILKKCEKNIKAQSALIEIISTER